MSRVDRVRFNVFLFCTQVYLENRYVWTKRESSEIGEPILEAIEFVSKALRDVL